MAHVISMEGSETSTMPNERLEALKVRYILAPDNQHQLGDGGLNKIMDRHLYEATKRGDVEKFIDALEKVSESRKLALSLIFDQVSPSGNSLLHLAAGSGNDDVMELILIHFPNTMIQKNSSEDTALHVAVRYQWFNTIEKLIRWGIESEIIYWKNNDNKSPLYLAIEKCEFSKQRHRKGTDWEILQLLLQEYAQDEAYAVKIQGMSPVLAAIEAQDTELLEEIIDRLPKLLQARDENGGTPLHYAASVDNVWATLLLLEKCPDLALQTDKNGSYPIHIAFERRCSVAFLPLLYDTWPELAEVKNKKGQNILHVAAKAGNDVVVGWILKEWPVRSETGETDTEKLVNSKDVDGNTPLHLASIHNHCEVMRYLAKDKRIDLRLRNNDGLNALDVAMEPQSFSSKDPAVRGRKILIKAGVWGNKGRDVRSPREQSCGASESSKWIKDEINTQLLVATLVASVTFTAGFTLPGGYNASNDPHPGKATMLHKGVFQLFVICDTLAMYNSILAVVVLLRGNVSDIRVAERAYTIAGPLLLWAFIGMVVAFLAAIIVAVSKLLWLMTLILCIAVLYIGSLVGYYFPMIDPRNKVYL
ncbi:hypothetical protein BT93_C0801 [Corymbia citriodora subsp. variegata]|nr:hypothetical protein BT93_C0801 [Corymbia citriodora subsp. variegata]